MYVIFFKKYFTLIKLVLGYAVDCAPSRGRQMRGLGFLSAALLLGGCISTPVTGNEVGGVVAHGGLNTANAFQAAQKHCAAYGKSARITSVTFQDYSGDPVLFDCVSSK